ncbi:MAG: hypothetical protein JWR61_1026 [Ferruginibacter sp.]|nr:hypothetical protein [Ferruginibacter sp.]
MVHLFTKYDYLKGLILFFIKAPDKKIHKKTINQVKSNF